MFRLLHLVFRRAVVTVYISPESVTRTSAEVLPCWDPTASTALTTSMPSTILQGLTLLHFSAQRKHLLRASDLHFSVCREHFGMG